MNTVRMFFSLVTNFGLGLQQFDVKHAFLRKGLEEEIYMEIPPCFGKSLGRTKVCKLKKALYGLRQSPRGFERFSKVMLAIKCKQSHGDHTLFIKHSTSRGVIALLVYVDDITVTSNDPREKEALWHCLARECEIKELGKLKYFLGIKVAHSKEGMFVSQ